MKQGEILKEYANTKKISVAQMGRDLERERSQVYQLFKLSANITCLSLFPFA